MHRAFINAFATRRAFLKVDDGQIVFNVDCVEGTDLLTLFASDAADLTCLARILTQSARLTMNMNRLAQSFQVVQSLGAGLYAFAT